MNVRATKLIAGTVVVGIGIGGVAAAAAPARPAATYTLTASGTALKFSKSTINARAGSVTLRLRNNSSLPHNVAIKGRGAGRVVSRGGTSTVTARLRRGTYTYYCAVGSHERAGMKGRLVVR
jgi:plastocyanin